MLLGIAQRDMLAPEMVVKMQVEQCAVHIEEHAVDFMPWDHGTPVAEFAGKYSSRLSAGAAITGMRKTISRKHAKT